MAASATQAAQQVQGQSHLPSPGHPRGSQDAHSPTDHQAFFVLSSQDIQAAIIGVWKECWPGKEERRIKRELPPALGTPKDAEWLHCRIPFSSLLQSESLQDLTFPGHLQHWIWQEITPTLVSPETPHSHPVPICQAGRCPACLKELLLSCLPLRFPSISLHASVCSRVESSSALQPGASSSSSPCAKCQHQGQGKVMPWHGLGISFLCGSPFLLLLHQLSGSLLHCPAARGDDTHSATYTGTCRMGSERE